LVVLVVVMCGALGALEASATQALADTACPSGTDTWYGPGGSASLAKSGNWLTASNWSTGALPDSNCQALITAPGTYTVTVQPTYIGDDDPDNYGASVGSLVLGGPTGSQTVDVSGQSSIYNGETYNVTYLAVANASTINSTGTLLLDSTTGGEYVSGNQPGGAAQITGSGTWANHGTIDVQSEDPDALVNGPPGLVSGGGVGAFMTNEAGGTVNLISGPVAFGLANTGLVTNDGTITVDAAASLSVGGNSGTNDTFTNDGSIVNNGSITDGGAAWDQIGGSISGNTVAIGNNATLSDSSGAGQFVVTSATVSLTGTLPAGQTVTVQPGLPINLDGGTLVNDGTLVLQGNTISNGNQPTALFNGSIQNNGALDLDAANPAYVNQLNASVTNSHSGRVTAAGVVAQSQGVNGITFTNDGTATLEPSTVWNLYGGGTITNEGDGTLAPQIASGTNFATLSVGGTMTAAGTIAPALVGGYTPPAGQEFDVIITGNSSFHGIYTGTFSTVGAGFTADYTNAPATPGYVGLVYDKSSPTASGGAGGGTSGGGIGAQSSSSGTLRIGAGTKVTRGGLTHVTLTCTGASGASCGGTLKLSVKVRVRVSRKIDGHRRTVTELVRLRIGAASFALTAGQSRALSIKLSSQGLRLLDSAGKHGLAVAATSAPSAGSVVTRTVTLVAAPRAHKTEK
jgi:hypothetical protein